MGWDRLLLADASGHDTLPLAEAVEIAHILIYRSPVLSALSVEAIGLAPQDDREDPGHLSWDMGIMGLDTVALLAPRPAVYWLKPVTVRG